MIIILGLGNPGEKYGGHRHNIGSQILDTLAVAHDAIFTEKKIFHAEIASVGELLLVKPATFMNDSGKVARLLVREYDAPLVVVYDDITIPIGEVKCSISRGDGGHNGLTSIISELGTKDFFRIRVGIRPVQEELIPRIAPPNGFEIFMLSNFTPLETELKEQGMKRAIEIIEALPGKKFEEIMNTYN